MDGLGLQDIDAELARRGAASGGAAGSQGVGIADIDAELARRGVDASQPTPAARQQLSGPVANFAAGGNEFAADTLGAPVDAATWLVNKAASGVDAIAERRVLGQIENPIGGSNSIKTAMGLIRADPRNVVAADDFDRAARGTGAGVVGMVAPYAAGRAAIVNGVTEGLPGAAARLFGGPAAADAGIARSAAGAASNAAIGGAGGALGAEGENLLPEDSPYRPLVNFAGQMVGGGLVAGGMGAGRAALNYGVSQSRDLIGPLNEAFRQRLVGDKLRGAAADPDALARALDTTSAELVPGSAPTTFQLSGDRGIGDLEAAQRAANPAPFDQRYAGQNAARIGQLQSLAPEQANPGAVRDFLQQRLAQIDSEGEANTAAVRQTAQQAFDQAGGQIGREDLGATMRGQLEAAKAATKQQESALWQAIDPEGKLTIDATPVRTVANEITQSIPSTAKPPEGEEKAVLGFAQLGGTAQPFQDFAALRGRLLQAIRDERINGQTPALRRMQMLRSAMDDTISSMVDRAAQNDPALLGRLSQKASDYYGGADTAAARATAGGYGGVPPTVNPGVGPQAAPGVSGTALPAGSGFGRAPGYQSVPEAPRPQDLIQFLLERGGVKDAGGELRSMDMDKINKGYFGRLSRSTGMPLDTAREIAVENRFLHPDSDINDLLDAIRRTSMGNPVFREGDPAVLDWQAYDQARRRGDFEPQMPPLPGEPATWDAAAALRYRAAADATRNRAQTFNNQLVGPALAERGNEYRMLESGLPERFIASPEAAQAFLAAGGDRGTLQDALVTDLRRSATTPDGTLNPTRYASWQARRGDVLKSFPELQQTLGDAATAQEAVDTAAAQAQQQRVDFQRSAARHFLNAEPTQAVQSALSSKNPSADMAALKRMVTGNPDAEAGLQRAVADHLVQRVIGNAEGKLNATALNNLMKREQALGQVFAPEQMQAIRDVMADIARSKPAPGGTAPPLQAGNQSVLSRYIGHGTEYLGHGLAGLAGYLIGGLHGAVEGTGAYSIAKGAVDALKRNGIARSDQLLTEALLNPEIAKALLMKASIGNRTFVAQRLSQQLGTLAGSAAAQEAQEAGRRK